MSLMRTLSHGLLASMFILQGTDTFIHPDQRAKTVEKANIPQPRQATILNGTVMMVAGTALALDFAPKLAALALVGALIPTTFVGHSFWQEENPSGRMGQRIHFNKNIVMIGGLLGVLLEK